MFPQLFRRKSSEDGQEKSDNTKTFETLMMARFDRLEENFTGLRTEWADVYDKIMHLYDRTRKRVRKAEVAPDEEKTIVPTQSPAEQRDMVLRAFQQLNGRNDG